PDGGVIVLAGTSYASISATGTTRWTRTPSAPKGTIANTRPAVVDTAGNVALPFNYLYATADSPQNTGIEIDFLTTTSTSGLPPFNLETKTCDVNYGEELSPGDLKGEPIDVGPGRMYAGLTDRCVA